MTVYDMYMTIASKAEWISVWILISWLLKKPADQDLRCFQMWTCLVSAESVNFMVKPMVLKNALT